MATETMALISRVLAMPGPTMVELSVGEGASSCRIAYKTQIRHKNEKWLGGLERAVYSCVCGQENKKPRAL